MQGLAVERGGKREIWLANLMGDRVRVDLEDGASFRSAVLDADSFIEAAGNPEYLDTTAKSIGPAIELDAYAVMRLTA